MELEHYVDGRVINSVPLRVDSYVWSTSSSVDELLTTRSTCRLPRRNFLSQEFGAKLQRKVPVFWTSPNFLTTQGRTGRLHAKIQLDPFSHFSRTPCVRQ